ncbi:amino acid ABC transporter permease [Paramicrobacterium chengjingii]|uniref:amino acid ABC transporter permease n=1 Tax=Paramicrobacterium chengjingii TaxID=2769067 RepID=UPI0014243BE0|nr:amino acid ABC transporter permease [Microbacterium chengjingii]
MTLDFSVLIPYAEDFVRALGLTLILSLSGFAISSVLAAVLLPARMSRHALLRWPTWLYVEVLRNIPILLVLYVVFFALPQIGINTDSWIAAIVALAFNSTAYLVEIYRGGLNSIPRGRYEAAAALNLSNFTVWTRILLPEALRTAFPAIGNQLVACVLGSSLAVLIGVNELTGLAYKVGSSTFRYFEAFITVAIVYFVVVQVVNFLWDKIGSRVNRMNA